MEQGWSRDGADLVSPILRSVSNTCRKNWRGIPRSPRMFYGKAKPGESLAPSKLPGAMEGLPGAPGLSPAQGRGTHTVLVLLVGMLLSNHPMLLHVLHNSPFPAGSVQTGPRDALIFKPLPGPEMPPPPPAPLLCSSQEGFTLEPSPQPLQPNIPLHRAGAAAGAQLFHSSRAATTAISQHRLLAPGRA